MALADGIVVGSFFSIGLAVSIAWASVCVSTPYWTAKFGNGIWPRMLLAYNVPGIPVLLLQLATDHKLDVAFGVHWTSGVRGISTITLLGAAWMMVPLYVAEASSSVLPIAFSTTLGLVNGLAYGSMVNWAATFGPRPVGSFLCGTGVSSFVAIALDATVGITNGSSRDDVFKYSGFVLIVHCVGYFGILLLACFARRVSDKEVQGLLYSANRSQSVSEFGLNKAAHEDSQDDPEPGCMRHASSLSVQAGVQAQEESALLAPVYSANGSAIPPKHSPLRLVAPSLLGIALVSFSITYYTALIPFVPTPKGTGEDFHHLLFYILLSSKFAGDALSTVLYLGNVKAMLVAASCHATLLVGLLLYCTLPARLNQDTVFCVASGIYIVACQYWTCKAYAFGAYAVENVVPGGWASTRLSVMLYLANYLALAVAIFSEDIIHALRPIL